MSRTTDALVGALSTDTLGPLRGDCNFCAVGDLCDYAQAHGCELDSVITGSTPCETPWDVEAKPCTCDTVMCQPCAEREYDSVMNELASEFSSSEYFDVPF
jgi:hypothetical protein